MTDNGDVPASMRSPIYQRQILSPDMPKDLKSPKLPPFERRVPMPNLNMGLSEPDDAPRPATGKAAKGNKNGIRFSGRYQDDLAEAESAEKRPGTAGGRTRDGPRLSDSAISLGEGRFSKPA
jgi:hypothetical protein